MDDKALTFVGPTTFQKKGCLSENISNNVEKYMTDQRRCRDLQVEREVVNAKGFFRRWDMRWVLKGNWDSGKR